MTEVFSFEVLGESHPEGSTKAFYIPKLKRTVTTHQNQKELEAWRSRVATEAQKALPPSWSCDTVSHYGLEVHFVLSRPPSVPRHLRLRPIVKPDLDKLARAVGDALTGIVWVDDAQVVGMSVTKDYSDWFSPPLRPGAYVTVQQDANIAQKPPRQSRGRMA